VSWWPVELGHGDVQLRPMRLRDGQAWREARLRNQAWLERWEGAPPTAPALPWDERHTLPVFASMLRAQRRLARQGVSMPFAVTYADRLVGQVTVSSIVRGAFDSASIGYWVDGEVAGRGVIPTAVALVVDHCFAVGLHRIEISIRPENAASLRVVEKLGFRPEGRHERYLYIDGDWRDHVSFALVREDLEGSLLRRWIASERDTPRHLHQD
jgi:ribosomal-protein-alanine N-acetyltransferase